MPDEPTQVTDPEDRKLITLARSTRARTGAREGAAVRDQDGRTYAAATVDLPSLQLSALQVAVAMALAGGSRGLEAVVVLGDGDSAAEGDLAVVRDFAGSGVPLLVVGPDGTLRATEPS
jgi:hypothetical protein